MPCCLRATIKDIVDRENNGEKVLRTEHITDTQTKITLDNGDEIYLVGTAHVSLNSVEEVEQVIDTVQPDHVCLELDRGRFDSKTKAKDYSAMDLKKVFKEGKAFLVLANTALASFQKKMGVQTGSAPGEEILSAGRIAQERGIPFSLCDRDISVTFKRAWRKSSFINRMKLLATLLSAVFDREEFKPEDLEELKKSDTLQEMMNSMAKELPSVKEVLIDERDRYLASSILSAPGHKKVAVVGAGHAPGIVKTIEKLEKKELSADIEDLNTVPPASKWGKVLTYMVPAIILGIVVFSCINYGFSQGLRAFLIWVGANAACTTFFAILSNAHPLNWLVCAVMAPISVMSPILGIGIVSAIVESDLRKPTVKDFENMTDDIAHFRMWYKNRILHAFMLLFTTTFGSMLGTVALFPILLKVLS